MIEQDYYKSGLEASVEDAPLSGADGARIVVSWIGVLTQLATRKRSIVLATCIGLLAGGILSMVLPVEYTATTKIMPPQQSQSSASLLMSQLANSGAGSLVAAAAGGGFGVKNPNDIYIGLLNSRPVADAIIHRFELTREYRSKDMSAARLQLAKNTWVASEKSGLLAVSVTDREKKRAADIANAYTEELRTLSRTLAVTEASQRRLFYEEQLRRTKEDLVEAEEAFLQVQKRRGIVQLDAQGKAMIESMASLRAQVAAKEVQIQAARSYSTDHNPDVQLAERELSSLRVQLGRLGQKSHSEGFSDLGLGDVPAAGLDFLSAQHEVQYRQILFDLILKQYDAARLDEAKDSAIIQVVEQAIPPDRRTSPHRFVIMVLFAALGFLSACFFFFATGFLRRYPETAKSLLALRSAIVSQRATATK